MIDRYRDVYRKAGHDPAMMQVGIHTLGFVADTEQAAIDAFYPAYLKTFNQIGRERGWAPITAAQFDAMRGPTGALLLGTPETVSEKIHHINEALGGIDRVTIQLNPSSVSHDATMRAIELLGTRVTRTGTHVARASPPVSSCAIMSDKEHARDGRATTQPWLVSCRCW